MPINDSSECDLNLAELDRLERAVAEEAQRGDDVFARRQLDGACRNQLRPLLDLVDKMGEALRSLGYDGYDGQWHIKSCPSGQTYWLGRECTSQCAEVRTALEDYQRAKGKK